MTTLKGLFDPVPKQRKNFLLENIKEVKRKSRTKESGQEKKLSSAHSQIRRTCSTEARKSHSSSASLSHAKDFADKRQVQVHPTCCDERIKEEKDGVNLSARTTHYIEQENIPFKWTEVCPSLISHTICHQGVQTDDLNVLNVNDPIKPMKKRNSVSSKGNTANSLKRETKSTERFRKENVIQDEIDLCQEKVKEEFKSSLPQAFAPPIRQHAKQNPIEIPFKSPSNPKDGSTAGDAPPGLESWNNQKTDMIPKQSARNRQSDEPPFSELVSDVYRLELLKESTSAKRSQHDPLLPPPSYQKGVVPKYLSKRLGEQKLESAQSENIDPNCPPGHVVMPEDERKETLSLILKSYNELVSELNKMPVRTDTLKMKQRKIELEKQLDKLEEGIRVFSRSKVYVKLNE